MLWNWQQPEWPNFRYDAALLRPADEQFLRQAGVLIGTCKHLDAQEQENLTIELLTREAVKTSAIEGELLDRESVQASLRRQFGLDIDQRRLPAAEQGIARVMRHLYQHANTPLSHELLHSWHHMLLEHQKNNLSIGAYRTHTDPMHIVSGKVDSPTVHFEAPPSAQVPGEMDRFLTWFKNTTPGTKASISPLIRSGLAHLWFITIHPFEDGNGRLARAISEKALAEALGQPTLLALATVIEQDKKNYYQALAATNTTLNIDDWLSTFAQCILTAQNYTQRRVELLIVKTKLFTRFAGQLNPRQEKILTKLFDLAPEGFAGGLSAENYIALTKTSRSTATRDLTDLVNKNILIRQGERKHTRYFLANL